MSFLAIDIGNTRLKWAVYADGAEPGSPPQQHGAVFLENIDRLADEDWQDLPPPTRMLGSNVAGDAVRRRVEEQMEHWDLATRWVVPAPEAAGVKNGYDHPTRLGADRWVAVIGAHAHALKRGFDGPVLVVMVGTAVTVEALSSAAEFLGGLILPGHGIMLRALEGGTAGLRVPTGEVRDFPTNTSDALTTGGTFAITGAIERMARLLAKREGREPLLLMTGGAGWKVAPALDTPHELIDGLIFDGLLAINAARG
ncbi:MULTISPECIES: type III pantothenate kinase [unclassified Roseateles]|uniref:type III pantothenate kinase n=1 Tax=unclassified Roseateles TaxID=2626991 RepID=UPI0006F4807A|nr:MULTISPECIES: type III pantothenate kinase [unclassified Roseateles]KQW51453.1 type III pantothenate kinase [Pelomonas sp. Root405]KRA77685.1 type III pantothenate kinase [Pelomonas sp. Root662]